MSFAIDPMLLDDRIYTGDAGLYDADSAGKDRAAEGFFLSQQYRIFIRRRNFTINSIKDAKNVKW
jgi:hypothetical protein